MKITLTFDIPDDVIAKEAKKEQMTVLAMKRLLKLRMSELKNELSHEMTAWINCKIDLDL